MPRLRAEQLQSLTLTNAQISDGKRYDAYGVEIEGFDPNRLIDQAKIRNTQYQPNGWISRGVVNHVEVLPDWVADYEGRLFYVNASDELYLAIGTEPWYTLIGGNTASGWDAELTVRNGFDGTNWNGTIATQFQTQSYNFSPDASDLFVYMNGSLLRLDHDFEIVDQKTIRTLRNIEANDTITMLVILSNSMLNYATKAWVFDKIQSGGIQQSLDDAYDDGSIVTVDTRDVDWRLQPDKKFIISEAITGTPLPAVHLGTKNLTNGHNWQTRWQSFDITVQIGGNVQGPHRAFLNSPAVTATEVATEVSEALVSAGITDLFGYVDNGKVGIQSIAPGSDTSFTVISGTNALPIFGLTQQTAVGDDAYSSYHNFGLSVNGQDTTTLHNTEKFWFNVNGVEHFITTGVGTTYNQLRSTLNSELTSSGFTVTTTGTGSTQDIRVTRNLPGLSYPTLITPQSYVGQIEITQVTVSGDNNRNLSGKYFQLSSIDNALFGHEKDYYVWYHLNAEQEVSTITCNAENSNVTLADKYFDLHSPSADYYVWYEVETPQTAGYQELGLTAVVGTTSSGLTQASSYNFKVALDGGLTQQYTITTAPDIQPTAEVTTVTTVADNNNSLSGKHWTIDSQTGQGYYVWYNIDTPAAPEVTTITTIADVAQSLSGKKFNISTPTTTYTPWFSMMTDAGLPAVKEVTTVTTVGDVAQSLSGKYFNIDSADGSRHYVWYNMMTDAGVISTPETTEITVTGNAGNALSSKYFELSTTSTNYYVWYRMQTSAPVTGVAEITDVIIPADVNKSLSGKYWTFDTPYNEYYVWYRMEDVVAANATAQETTLTMDSQVGAFYDYNQDAAVARIYNFGDAYDIIWRVDVSVDGAGLSNPIIVDIDAGSTAADVATATAAAITAAAIPFTAVAQGDSVVITNNNVGQQTNNPQNLNNTLDVFTLTVTHTGTDYVAGSFSPNPNIAGRTGVQVNILEDDSNTDVAAKTNTRIALLPDVTTTINGAVITITNTDNGAVQDSADGNAGIVPNIVAQGVTTAPALYSTNPNIPGKTGIAVDILLGDDANTVALATASIVGALPQFDVVAVDDKLTITTTLSGAVNDATAGNTSFTVVVTEQGKNYVAPTFSIDPAPGSRTGIKIEIAEGDSAVTVAEATKQVVDATQFFSASRTNAVLTITDKTFGPVSDAFDANAGFNVLVSEQGQDYVAPTYTTPAIGTNLIKVDITQGDTDVIVAQALEAALNGVAGFIAVRVGNTITVTNTTTGVATSATDVDSGFAISTIQDGYAAYSSINPNIVARNGLKIQINKDDSAATVAAKTATVINAHIHFTASASDDQVTIVDRNGGAVPDATVATSGFNINVANQGTNIIYADLTWNQILVLLNIATSAPATWSITSGDVRLTTDTIGSWTSVSLDAGSGNNLFTNIAGFSGFNTAVSGTSSYSATPAGIGTPIKVALLKGTNAPTVALKTKNAIDLLADFIATVGPVPGVDDHIVTITNSATGTVANITDHDTGFIVATLNEGANESTDPSIAGKTDIRVDINKNDSTVIVATKTQAAVDLGGEFYVTRLNEIISIQNDNPGSVTPSTDGDTGFTFTRTGLGEDVKYSLFGLNGLGLTLPAPVAGIDALPANIVVGSASLSSGYNFYTFPKDFAVIINNQPVAEIFLNQATFNSSEVVSHVNARILASGVNNLEAYQIGGKIGFRTTQTGLSQSIQLKDSLSDALVTLGWTAGTYTGDFGAADSIFEVTALTGQNEITINGDFLPSAYGVHNLGSETAKFKEIWSQEAHFDAGTIYIGSFRISSTANTFDFIVDDGTGQYDFFGNTDITHPIGASRIGVAGVTGVIPNKVGAAPGDAGTLQEMLTGFAKSAGGGKVFPDMSSTGASYGDPTNLKGFLSEKANGLYLKLDEVVYVKNLNRSVIVKRQGATIVQGLDWDYLEDSNSAVGGKSIKFDLKELDAGNNPISGAIADDSFYVKTAGGIVLETAGDKEVKVTNDLRVMGDLFVEGNTVSFNTATLEVEDNSILLNKNWASAPTLSAGIEVERGTSTNAFLEWDETTDIWRAGIGSTKQAIAMRNDSQLDGGIAIWNSTTAAFDTTGTVANEYIQDVVGGMVSTNTESGISVTYDDVNGKLDFNVSDPVITLDTDVSGSATITNLGDTTINVTVNAASKVKNALTVGVSGTGLSGTSVTFDGSAAKSITVASNATSAGTTSGTIVARGTSGDFTAGTITVTGVSSSTGIKASTSLGTTGTVVTEGFTTSYSSGAYAPMLNLAVGYYGLGYLQAAAGYGGKDTIAMAFLGATVPTSANSAFMVNDAGNVKAAGTITASTFSGSLANTLTLNTSGTGLSGSTTFNNSGAATFTVASNATSANTASTIVARDASNNFSAGTITASLAGNASTINSATGRTDTAWYDIGWITSGTTQAYGCDDVQIQSSTGTIKAKALTFTNTGRSGGKINFGADPGAGSGDSASIEYYATGTTGETTRLQLNVANDADDIIYFNGNVGTAGSITGPGSVGSKVEGFEKIYNAVWNDCADFITVEDECEIEYGRVYYIGEDFKHRKTTDVAQMGTLGIASDTYGYGLGKDENKKQLPLAVAGFVLAYVEGSVKPGNALTSGPNGTLVVMSDELKRQYPERIIAQYYKPQVEQDYHGLSVNGRHWVKVK